LPTLSPEAAAEMAIEGKKRAVEDKEKEKRAAGLQQLQKIMQLRLF
jgi:hypothetical protein